MKEEEKKKPQVILQLSDNLSVGVMTAITHAQLCNIMKPELGFYHHVKKGLKDNGLLQLYLRNGDSWGITLTAPQPCLSQ